MEYIDFLKTKMAISQETGFKVRRNQLTPTLFPHVKDTVVWAVQGGCRAIFSSFGMQKTVTQLEILRLIAKKEKGKCLVVCPRRVVVEFETQAKEHLQLPVKYVRNMKEVKDNEKDYDAFVKTDSNKAVIYEISKEEFPNISFTVNRDKWISINRTVSDPLHFVVFNKKLIDSIEVFLKG
jgi:hypothetical protein